MFVYLGLLRDFVNDAEQGESELTKKKDIPTTQKWLVSKHGRVHYQKKTPRHEKPKRPASIQAKQKPLRKYFA